MAMTPTNTPAASMWSLALLALVGLAVAEVISRKAPGREKLAQAMSGALGRDHDHVHRGRRNDKLVVNIKPVGKHQGLARPEVWGDCFLVYLIK